MQTLVAEKAQNIEKVTASVKRVLCTIDSVRDGLSPSITLRETDGNLRKVTTSEKLLSKVLKMKDIDCLIATVVMNRRGHRLVSLMTAEESDSRPATPTVEETLDRFAGVHERLAQ